MAIEEKDASLLVYGENESVITSGFKACPYSYSTSEEWNEAVSAVVQRAPLSNFYSFCYHSTLDCWPQK